jgi:hypothetical protein
MLERNFLNKLKYLKSTRKFLTRFRKIERSLGITAAIA